MPTQFAAATCGSTGSYCKIVVRIIGLRDPIVVLIIGPWRLRALPAAAHEPRSHRGVRLLVLLSLRLPFCLRERLLPSDAHPGVGGRPATAVLPVTSGGAAASAALALLK
jgi:hypothetical protein